MATKTVTHLVDDLDGNEIPQGKGESVTFGIDGATYEVDLSDKNAKKLRDVLAPYVSAGRRISGGRGRPASGGRQRAGVTRDYDISALRAWAKSNKVEVPSRGRIPQNVVDAYKAAGN